MAYADVQIGVARVRGIGADTGTAITYAFVKPAFSSAVPEMRSLRFAHGADVLDIKDSYGRTMTIIGLNNSITCSFTFKSMAPSGTNTRVGALNSLFIPASIALVEITGLQVVSFGGFTDALNTPTGVGAGNRWIYKAGASADGDADSDWGLTVSLTKHLHITATDVVGV